MTTRPVLVTGATGRLGRALMRIGGGRLPLIGAARALRGDSLADTVISGLDITNPRAMQQKVADIRPQVIIHLAAMVGADCVANPSRAQTVNVAGTLNLITAAREHGVERVVFISTSAIYGDHRCRPVSEEDSPAQNLGVYAATKLEAEHVLAEKSGPVSVDVLRVFNVYGPGMNDSLVARLRNATVEEPARLTGLDEFVRDYVHVDDVARAIIAAAEASHPGFRILNVGSGIPRSNRDLLAAFPDLPPGAVVLAPALESYSCADVTAISRELSWNARHPWPPT